MISDFLFSMPLNMRDILHDCCFGYFMLWTCSGVILPSMSFVRDWSKDTEFSFFMCLVWWKIKGLKSQTSFINTIVQRGYIFCFSFCQHLAQSPAVILTFLSIAWLISSCVIRSKSDSFNRFNTQLFISFSCLDPSYRLQRYGTMSFLRTNNNEAVPIT